MIFFFFFFVVDVVVSFTVGVVTVAVTVVVFAVVVSGVCICKGAGPDGAKEEVGRDAPVRTDDIDSAGSDAGSDTGSDTGSDVGGGAGIGAGSDAVKEDSDEVVDGTVTVLAFCCLLGIEKDVSLRHFLFPSKISLGVFGIDRGVLGEGIDSIGEETTVVSPKEELSLRYVLLTMFVSQLMDSCCFSTSSLNAIKSVMTL